MLDYLLTSVSITAFFQGGHDLNMSAGPYPHPAGQPLGSNNNFYPNPQQYSGYGQVNYPGTNLADQQSMDTRRRAIEALNDFLGDVKRRALDPTSYYDLGQRLNSQSLPLPISSGNGYSLGSTYGNNNNQTNNYGSLSQLAEAFGGGPNGLSMNGGGGSGGVQGPLTQNYALPMSNARTKNDLLDIDRFLEQLQATVYESSNQNAVAGMQQHQTQQHALQSQLSSNFNTFNDYRRTSHSPPQYRNNQMQSSTNGVAMQQPLTSVAQMANMTAHAQSLDTPALTPASVSSHTSSGQSPISNHSRVSGDGASMYPQLPSVTSMSDMGASYTSAPPSGLASNFDTFDGRRYSGGRLQREAPSPRQDNDVNGEAMDLDDDRSKTPTKDDHQDQPDASSNVDPTLRSPQPAEDSTSSRTASTDDRTQEAWVENVRVIETLRNWVKDRLAQHDFERDADSTPEPADHQQQQQQETPVFMKHELPVADSNIDPNMDPQLEEEPGAKLEGQAGQEQHEQEHEHEHEQIAYPMLKAEA